MINSLKISNFQSHKDTLLQFHKGVNVIVGGSDSGKTAILRALRWLTKNRPNGDDFRSHWGGESLVEINTDDKFIITRSKDKENLYIINNAKWDEAKVLKAFGTKVPEEIQKALNIDDVNLQSQFDSPFLISSTPGEVAGYFNQIAHLERIDSSISYVNSKITTLTSQHKADQASISEFQEQLKQYDYLTKFEIDLEELEYQHTTQTQRIASRQRLGVHLVLVATNNARLKEQEQIMEREAVVDKLLRLYADRKAIHDDRATLQSTLTSINKKAEQEREITRKVKLLPGIETLLQLQRDRKTMWQDMLAFKNHCRDIRNTKVKQEECETKLEEQVNLFHEHMPDICPLCGKETT